MRSVISAGLALAMASSSLVFASAAHATSVDEFTVKSAVATQSIGIRQGGEGGGFVIGGVWHDLGTHSFGDGETQGETSVQGSLFPQATAMLDACGAGDMGLCFGGNASANAETTVTYEYIFTAKNPGEVQSLIHQSMPLLVYCDSRHAGPCDSGLPYQPNYYIPAATKIDGAFTISSEGYARGTVSADGYAPGGLGQFELECGYGGHDRRCNGGHGGDGTFEVFGVLGANDASVAANSFFGFVTLRASAALFEGGRAYAAIDPVISLNLAGVDPNDFTLTLSPGFVNAGPGDAGVPEPAQWALMLAGFGLVGVTARRRRALAATA
jgi:hypothetical protein